MNANEKTRQGDSPGLFSSRALEQLPSIGACARVLLRQIFTRLAVAGIQARISDVVTILARLFVKSWHRRECQPTERG